MLRHSPDLCQGTFQEFGHVFAPFAGGASGTFDHILNVLLALWGVETGTSVESAGRKKYYVYVVY